MAERDMRVIEHAIPLQAVNEASAKEKKHPRRHVELIHQWPARRPRSASRVAIAAALLKVPRDDKQLDGRLGLLEALSPYECSKEALENARALIRREHGGRAPKVLDMFAGGGAIPLEAANLGCDAYAVELNPVAHIIELATCVYPQKYGPKLADSVEKWGKKILDEVKQEIGDLYPAVRMKGKRQARQLVFAADAEPDDGAILFRPLAYLWTRTVPCVDRDCGAMVPLVRQTWLCRKEGRAIAMKMVADRKAKLARFEIISAANEARLGFDPAAFSERGDAECPICGAAIDAAKVKDYGKRGKIGYQLMAVAGTVEGERGRVYLPAEAVEMPSDTLVRKRLAAFGDEWPGPAKLSLAPEYTGGSCVPYGLNEFWKLFTERQAIALLTFSRSIRSSYERIAVETKNDDLARAVVTYLALTLDKLADNTNSLCRWEASDQITKAALSRQALPMLWDFAEIVPYADLSGSFTMALAAEVQAIEGLSGVPRSAVCLRGSATDLPFGDEHFDAVVTDPPYYDNISYADLSDFFYVWLKRTLQSLYPDDLTAEQTPKRQEATVVPYRHNGDDERARRHYEDLMARALAEAGRTLRPGGPLVVVYAHKTVAGWATLVDALRRASCTITEAWPLRTESDARLNARNTAALATSIFLAARKRTEATRCEDYDDELLPIVRAAIAERVAFLWDAGLTGSDLVIAVVGAALGSFTQYSKVRRANGAEVRTEEFLDEAQRLTLDAVLKRVVRDAVGKEVSLTGIDPVSRLYVVGRMQFGDTPADYDSFKNLAIGALPPGTELDGMRGALMAGNKAVLGKKGNKVLLRSFEDRGKERGLGLMDDGKMPPLVDVLHRLLWLQKNRPGDIGKFVNESKADLASVRLLAQALGGRPLRSEPRPGAQKDERTSEQRAIDTFLASFGDIARGAGPLFQ
jgi:putative DNA methylase